MQSKKHIEKERASSIQTTNVSEHSGVTVVKKQVYKPKIGNEENKVESQPQTVPTTQTEKGNTTKEIEIQENVPEDEIQHKLENAKFFELEDCLFCSQKQASFEA